MSTNIPKLPKLNICKTKEIILEPNQNPSKKNSKVPILSTTQRWNEEQSSKVQEKDLISPKFSGVSSKINTNRREVASSLVFPDIKFESVKWSGSSILHPGFFHLPAIRKSQPPLKQANFYSPDKIRSNNISEIKNFPNENIEKIKEVPQEFKKTGKKFEKIKSTVR